MHSSRNHVCGKGPNRALLGGSCYLVQSSKASGLGAPVRARRIECEQGIIAACYAFSFPNSRLMELLSGEMRLWQLPHVKRDIIAPCYAPLCPRFFRVAARYPSDLRERVYRAFHSTRMGIMGPRYALVLSRLAFAGIPALVNSAVEMRLCQQTG